MVMFTKCPTRWVRLDANDFFWSFSLQWVGYESSCTSSIRQLPNVSRSGDRKGIAPAQRLCTAFIQKQTALTEYLRAFRQRCKLRKTISLKVARATAFPCFSPYTNARHTLTCSRLTRRGTTKWIHLKQQSLRLSIVNVGPFIQKHFVPMRDSDIQKTDVLSIHEWIYDMSNHIFVFLRMRLYRHISSNQHRVACS